MDCNREGCGTGYYIVAVSHIDMAFVMREEAYEECLEILLERVLGVLERNPQICFALEQAAHYRKLQLRRPGLFQRVREYLQAGRLEFMGGMATTAETNFPNGECLVRNQGMGLLWLEQNFGVSPRAGWLMDTFGLHAQVPQIMSQFGFRHLYADRFGGNKRFDAFTAEGLDGSRVVVIGKDSASGNLLPDSQAFVFCREWKDVDLLFQQAEQLSGDLPRLVTYYIENEEVFSEYYLKLAQDRIVQGAPWKHATYEEYSRALEAHESKLPILWGDLNPEFTGTFALRTPIKTENRKAETALLDAEKWAAVLGADQGAALEECWWDLFFCQFHDAFTGSHEDVTYHNVLNRFSKVISTAGKARETALRLEKDPGSLLCVNSLPWARTEWVELEAGRDGMTVLDAGRKVPQCRRDGKVCFLGKIPAGGMKRYDILYDVPSEPGERTERTAVKEIRNECLHLVLSERNGIEKLEDTQGNCYLFRAWDFLTVQKDLGGMQIEDCGGSEIYAATGQISVGEAYSDAMGERIGMSGVFPAMGWNRANRLSWKMEFDLRRGERGLRVKVILDWKGDSSRIRLKVPCAFEGRDVYHEIPFGVIRREAYSNLPTAKGEWPVQRFAALENGTMGVALINTGVAGVEQEGRTLASTLIRAYGDGPDAWVRPTALSRQEGISTFEFMILPYQGNFQTAQVQKTAQEFNQRIDGVVGKSGLCPEEVSFFELDGDGLVLSAIKKAWDHTGDLVVRIYESEGKRSQGRFRLAGMKEVWSSDMKEEKGERLACAYDTVTLEFTPFEIRTLRVRI